MEINEQQELLKAMSDRLERMEKRQKREKAGRIIAWCCALVLILALVVVAGPKVKAMVDKYNAAMTEVEKVSEALKGVNLDGVKEAAGFLNTVDFEALREKTADLSKLATKLSTLDIEKLNDTIDNLNKALKPLLEFFS